MIRLNRYLSQRGLASRRDADELISQGLVAINGRQARLGDTLDPAKDQVTISGQPLSPTLPSLEYYLVNKPIGYVTTVSDPEGRPTVTALVKSKHRLYPVGRLDQDSEGLVLLTNDGDLTYRLTHPKHHISKTYHVLATGSVTPVKLARLCRGVSLKEGKTAPAKISIIRSQGKKTLLSVTLYEGKNRQIRRMFSTQKLEVAKLKRVAIGNLQLGNLEPGTAQKLDREHLYSLLYSS